MRSLVQGMSQHSTRLRNVQVYYDFLSMAEANGATITTITDEKNSLNGSGANSPTCEVISFNGDSIKSYKDETNKGFSMGTPGGTLFNHSFEIWVVLSSTDGRQTSGIQICGSRPADTNRQFSAFINVSGDIISSYGYTGLRATHSLAAAIPDGSLPITFLRIRWNFEGDAVLVYINGEVRNTSPTLSNISNLDPTLYDNTVNMHVGTINQNGTLQSNDAASNFYKFLVTFRMQGAVANSIDDKLLESAIINDLIKHYTQWQGELGVTTANIASKRADMIDYIFNGNGLPAGATPDSTTATYTGLMHGVNTSSLTGAGTVSRMRWDIVDGDTETWLYYQYLIPNSVATNNWILVHRGHGSEGAAASLSIINRCLAEGFNVLWVAMPKGDPDTDGQNTTTNPDASLGHEALYVDGIDTVSYNALELFLASQVRAINYLHATYTVNSLYAIGLSGGAYSVSMLAAIDTRITKTSAHRGFMPRSAKYYPWIIAGHEPDFEQGGANGLQAKCGPRVYQFFTDHPQLEIMAMCTDGGRLYGSVTHVNDSSVFGGFTWLAWKDALKTKALELGGRYFQFVSQAAGESLHSYHTTEMDRTFYEFGL